MRRLRRGTPDIPAACPHFRCPACLADHLPWAALVAPGVVLNKDGSFLAAARFRGPDLESSTAEELTAARARLNNALKRLGSGWCLLLKRVVATAGSACAHGDLVTAGGRQFSRVAQDRLGATLPHWKGCRTLARDEVFLTGDDRRSFDSRYFGPVSVGSIVGVYEQLK